MSITYVRQVFKSEHVHGLGSLVSKQDHQQNHPINHSSTSRAEWLRCDGIDHSESQPNRF